MLWEKVKSMQTFYGVTLSLLPGFFILTCVILCIYFFQKEKIYRYPSDKWLPIKEYPIPKDIRGFIGTDGKKVDYVYQVTWAPYGEIFFNTYDKTYITHWMPLPDAPKNK
jgi:Protein of unknown function (DUF551)